MLTVWWDAKGIISLDFWKKSNNISYNASYYQNLLTKVRQCLPTKRRGILKARPLVLIDNAPIHTACETRRCIENCGFEIIEMPPYSPDVAPSDYYLFRNLKSWLQGQYFTCEEELISKVTAWFEAKPAAFYERGIDQLKDRMNQLVNLNGEYLS
jgi:histone-lysine N-methyltransferase SETMAR